MDGWTDGLFLLLLLSIKMCSKGNKNKTLHIYTRVYMSYDTHTHTERERERERERFNRHASNCFKPVRSLFHLNSHFVIYIFKYNAISAVMTSVERSLCLMALEQITTRQQDRHNVLFSD